MGTDGMFERAGERFGSNLEPTWAQLGAKSRSWTLSWAVPGVLSNAPNVQDPAWTQLGPNLEPTWSQLGANLGLTWSQLGANLDCLGGVQRAVRAAQ